MPVIIHHIIFIAILWRTKKSVLPKVQVLDVDNTVNSIYPVLSSHTCHISNKEKVPKCWWDILLYWEEKLNKMKPIVIIYHSQQQKLLLNWVRYFKHNQMLGCLLFTVAEDSYRTCRNCFNFVTSDKFTKLF